MRLDVRSGFSDIKMTKCVLVDPTTRLWSEIDSTKTTLIDSSKCDFVQASLGARAVNLSMDQVERGHYGRVGNTRSGTE